MNYMNYMYLVRHGRTRWNEERRLQGVSDIDVSEGGLRETEETARFFRWQDIAEVWTSPLIRCRRLADAIVEDRPGVVLRTEKDLVESNFGKWEGLTAAEIAQRYPVEWQAYSRDRMNFRAPGGEAFTEVAHRVLQVFRRAMQAKGPVVLVTHYNVLIAILAYIEGMPVSGLVDMPYPPGGVTKVEHASPAIRAYPVFRPDSGKWFTA